MTMTVHKRRAKYATQILALALALCALPFALGTTTLDARQAPDYCAQHSGMGSVVYGCLTDNYPSSTMYTPNYCVSTEDPSECVTCREDEIEMCSGNCHEFECEALGWANSSNPSGGGS